MLKRNLRVLSILDDFTYNTLLPERQLDLITKKPLWYRLSQKIDVLLVESAWRGNHDQWRHKIAHYPEHPDRNINELKALVEWCKERHIPTVFWNKEDPFHYDQFLNAARLFDYVLTTDANSLSRYRTDIPNAKVGTATFFIQPQLHFQKNIPTLKRSLFMGSYDAQHPERANWQDRIFPAAARFGLDIVNRHPKSMQHYEFPQYIGDVNYFNPIPYRETPNIYRRYQHILNVNTITNSPTMFSRRLIEIMACGRLAISNPSLAIQHLFKDMCIQVDDIDEAAQLFSQLQTGYSKLQRDMVAYAHAHIQQHYTAKAWLKSILHTCQLDHPYLAS